MMRKTLTVAVAVLAMAAFGMPAALAQSFALGSLAGRAVDAAGRGVAGQRVELVRGAEILHVETTDSRGEWAFRDVVAGDYIVRMNVRGKIAGVRLSVGVGQAVSGTLIVVPTATVSPQLGMVAGLLAAVPSIAVTATVATIAATTTVEETAVNNEILMSILQELTPTARVAFAQAIIAAIPAADKAQGTGFAQYTTQLNTVVASGGQTVPTFPPAKGVST